jgi:hypothetical protein
VHGEPAAGQMARGEVSRWASVDLVRQRQTGVRTAGLLPGREAEAAAGMPGAFPARPDVCIAGTLILGHAIARARCAM